MNYSIKFKQDSLKFIQKQPQNNQKRILQAIKKLPNGDTKRLIGIKNQTLFRLRTRQFSYNLFY